MSLHSIAEVLLGKAQPATASERALPSTISGFLNGVRAFNSCRRHLLEVGIRRRAGEAAPAPQRNGPGQASGPLRSGKAIRRSFPRVLLASEQGFGVKRLSGRRCGLVNPALLVR